VGFFKKPGWVFLGRFFLQQPWLRCKVQTAIG